ncbi:GNAT family N-acetyltransferase [Leifsonia sp. F6_8S_P_1B]|uniref:GNAT family N-acetyltransferase n=1 Tax=Leifsonia williamsii TaxID=3035919 RepID=A0ABT8KD63_9MICO|nr:GNAT family N-acetyltransferase [Leifsonia williamsii]MDN4615396.1 GNAT family N-acetyltransferase [Leifsonia williamsii]
MHALRTARLILDAPREDDVDAVLDACTDPETQRGVPVPSPYTRADAEYFVRSYCPHGELSGRYLVWALRTAPGEPLLGTVEVRRDQTAGAASLGCWLRPSARGHGYMREAVRVVIGYALDPAGLACTELRWDCLPGNLRSRRLGEAVGFAFDAGEHRTLPFRGESRDTLSGVLRAAS